MRNDWNGQERNFRGRYAELFPTAVVFQLLLGNARYNSELYPDI